MNYEQIQSYDLLLESHIVSLSIKYYYHINEQQ